VREVTKGKKKAVLDQGPNLFLKMENIKDNTARKIAQKKFERPNYGRMARAADYKAELDTIIWTRHMNGPYAGPSQLCRLAEKENRSCASSSTTTPGDSHFYSVIIVSRGGKKKALDMGWRRGEKHVGFWFLTL